MLLAILQQGALTLAASASSTTRMVSSVLELRSALADTQVTTIYLLRDIKITADEWPENAAVTVAGPRAVTIASRSGLPREQWPLIEFTGIHERIILQSTNITFSRVWIYRARSGSSTFAYPGEAKPVLKLEF